MKQIIYMERYKPIDAFRGLAILGMVFFTVTLRLSSDLPDILRHNVWGSVHLGDFILPMFLFASGISLAFYLEKRKKEERNLFFKEVFKRFFKLVLVGISLSIFSAYGFLEMDEVMLSALLFIVCVGLFKFNWKLIIGLIFLINLSYLVLIELDKVNIFVGHYLGGYPAALYYLPVMLTGFFIGKETINDKTLNRTSLAIIFMIFLFFIFFWWLIPLNKLIATPSFIMLSILFSFLFFVLIEKILKFKISIKKLEFIGKQPLRYWLLMYVVFLIPLWFYVEITDNIFPLNISWYLGVLISLGLMVLFYIIAYLIEYVTIANRNYK